MNVCALKDFCHRLDEAAAVQEIMGGDPTHVALHRDASNALREAISEIERLRSSAADLHHSTTQSNLPLPMDNQGNDWFKKFLERKRALTREKLAGTSSDRSGA